MIGAYRRTMSRNGTTPNGSTETIGVGDVKAISLKPPRSASEQDQAAVAAAPLAEPLQLLEHRF